MRVADELSLASLGMDVTPTVIFGIPNCDTVKAVRRTIAEAGLDVVFHNYRTDGVPTDKLTGWMNQHGWEAVLNRSGTTWRRLSEQERSAVVDTPTAVALAVEHDAVIRRPIIEWTDGSITIGRADAVSRLSPAT